MTSRASKRCAVAAAGIGLVLAAFGTGSVASAATSDHHGSTARTAAGRVHPNIAPTAPAVTMTAASLAQLTVPTLAGGTAGALSSLTITDPGIIRSTDTVSLNLIDTGQDLSLDTTAAVSVVTTGTGTTAGPVTVTGTQVSFPVTKTDNATDSTYVLSGIHVVGASTVTSQAFGFNLDAIYPGNLVEPSPVEDAFVDPVTFGAVMHLIPAAYGPTSPDTAAALFRAAAQSFTHIAVLASDSEPQDAESANYLVAGLSFGQSPKTGILLTDPTTLSPAAASVLHDFTQIDTVYIVGGTSVVSGGIETQLTGEGYTVIRLAGPTQYDTNEAVTNYVANTTDLPAPDMDINYAQTQYNSTSGASSATSTGVGDVKTAIVASGSIDSFQDGIVSGALSVGRGMPVILTSPTSLSATAEALLTEGSYKQVILLGGPAAVSDAVEAQLTASTASGGAGVVAFRIAGADASDTSTQLAHFLVDHTNIGLRDNGTSDGGVLIARGSGFQDALATGPYAGNIGFTPITLTENASVLGAPLTAYLKYAGTQCVFSLQAVGGPLSVSPAVQQAGIDAEFSGLPGCTLLRP